MSKRLAYRAQWSFNRHQGQKLHVARPSGQQTGQPWLSLERRWIKQPQNAYYDSTMSNVKIDS